MVERLAVIVAGPTCSGKSALAMALAERLGGTVINADSMQVYRELRVLTARPTPAEEALVPHALFGMRPAAEPGSVAWWRDAALAAMERAKLPILCGGTGLYLASLTEGLAAIADAGAAAREEARRLLAELGPAALHARLAEVDPETARRLHPNDRQRIARAWEVWRGTGRGLAAWLAPAEREAAGAARPWRFVAVLLDPPRDDLRAAIGRRFAAMLEAGALEEVRALLALGLDASLPAMRAHCVPELSAHLRGEITLEEAARRAGLATGRYAKRQATWFRHHRLSPWTRTIDALNPAYEQFSERRMADLLNFICSAG